MFIYDAKLTDYVLVEDIINHLKGKHDKAILVQLKYKMQDFIQTCNLLFVFLLCSWKGLQQV